MKTEFLNDNEIKVLRSLVDSSAGNGHDFGFTDEWQECGFTPKQMAGYIGQLSKKGYLNLDDLSEDAGVECNAVQFVFTLKAEELLNDFDEKVYVEYNHWGDER